MSDPPDQRGPFLEPTHPADAHRFAHDAMACTWGIHILGHERDYAEQAARAAFAEIDRLEQELSRFVEGSDIARINALPAGEALRIGPEAFECIGMAQRLHNETHGAFDITVGALLESGHRSQDPAPARGRHLHLDRRTHSVTVAVAGLVVDLGGIGKGFAIDRAAETMREWSVDTALIHSGQSTLLALGTPLDSHGPAALSSAFASSGSSRPLGWQIALRDPDDHARVLGTVRLRDRALSGSGTAIHGRHIIDPRSGEPAAGPRGAWALADSAAVSDALSTAFMVLSPGEVEEFCRGRTEVGALLLLDSGRGRVLKGFGELLAFHDVRDS